MTNCLFCKIISKEIPAEIVFEDEHSLAFLDINPRAKGHTLLIPKKHATDIRDLADVDQKAFMNSLQSLSTALMDYSEGLNIVQNNGSVAGQVIFHLHFHLIPRRQGDGIKIGEWEAKRAENLKEVQKEVQNLLKN